MFRNFYSSPALRNHNFSDFFEHCAPEQVSEEYLEDQIRNSYLPDSYGAIDPYLYSVIPLTLSPECCASFIRANPGLPITERDYYLSKLFQFLYVVLAARFDLDPSETTVKDRVQGFLDEIPSEQLSELGRFDWAGFHSDSYELNLEELLERLPAYLPRTRRETTAGEAKQRESPGEVIDRLRRQHGWTIEQLAFEAGVDCKQIYKIKRGEGVHTETVIKIAKALGCKPGDLLAE